MSGHWREQPAWRQGAELRARWRAEWVAWLDRMLGLPAPSALDHNITVSLDGPRDEVVRGIREKLG